MPIERLSIILKNSESCFAGINNKITLPCFVDQDEIFPLTLPIEMFYSSLSQWVRGGVDQDGVLPCALPIEMYRSSLPQWILPRALPIEMYHSSLFHCVIWRNFVSKVVSKASDCACLLTYVSMNVMKPVYSNLSPVFRRETFRREYNSCLFTWISNPICKIFWAALRGHSEQGLALLPCFQQGCFN